MPLWLSLRQPRMERLALAAEDLRAELPIRAAGIALFTDRLGDVEGDRHWEHVVAPGELDERPPRLGLDIRGVDDREQPARQPHRPP